MPAPFFFSFEGPEGAGKTSVLTAVLPEIEKIVAGPVLLTREPGGTPIAEAIRNILKSDESAGMDARTEALLFAAARRQHLQETILPALARKQTVVSDRYLDSSIAYQGYGRGLGYETVWDINQFATEGFMPDMTIYLDLPVEVGLSRIHAHRKNKIDRLDKEDIDFHKRVREGYLSLADRFSDRIKTINADQALDPVIADVIDSIKQYVEVHS